MANVASEPHAANKPSAARWLVVAVPYIWLLLFFVAPFLIIFKISLSDTAIALPPYTPVFEGFGKLGDFISQLDFENYIFLTDDPLYFQSYVSSLRIALISTVLLLLIGYPMALAMARAPSTIRPTLVMMVILPFWTSFLIRVYAWIGILKPDGLLTLLLHTLHLMGPDDQVEIFRTDTAVFIGIVYSYLPFMVLPLYAALEKMDNTLLEAASDLGCTPWKAFWRITFPLSLPGVIAGSMICFIPITGEFRHPRSARRRRYADDRQDALDRVLRQPRLAARLRRGGGAAGHAGRADRHLPEPAEEGGLK